MIKKLSAIFVMILLIAVAMSVPVAADRTNQYNYTYGPNGFIDSVPGFSYAHQIDSAVMPAGGGMKSVDDVCVGGGRLYVADSVASAVHIFDAADCTFIATIAADESVALKKPSGLYLDEQSGELYIADSEAKKIFVLNTESLVLSRAIEKPENMTGDTEFSPYKVTVDELGRIYVVVKGAYEGIVELNSDGSFSRYLGVNKPKVNLVEYFWRSIATESQKKRMSKAYAPSFNGIDIDADGFVFAVTGDTASEDKIFRFNAKGENVIRAEGYQPLIGDVKEYFENTDTTSVMVDVAVNSLGSYAVLDGANGRVFVYDMDGYLISIFSGKGNIKGEVAAATCIEWNGDGLLIGDSDRGAIYIYQPTEFGTAALSAVESYNKGDWNAATESYKTAIELNANFYAGYSGIGRNYLMKHDYSEAVYYYKLAKDKTGYSQAYHGYRGLLIKKYFAFFAAAFLLLAVALVVSEVHYNKKRGRNE